MFRLLSTSCRINAGLEIKIMIPESTMWITYDINSHGIGLSKRGHSKIWINT